MPPWRGSRPPTFWGPNREPVENTEAAYSDCDGVARMRSISASWSDVSNKR
jgi:hypothetical protein